MTENPVEDAYNAAVDARNALAVRRNDDVETYETLETRYNTDNGKYAAQQAGMTAPHRMACAMALNSAHSQLLQMTSALDNAFTKLGVTDEWIEAGDNDSPDSARVEDYNGAKNVADNEGEPYCVTAESCGGTATTNLTTAETYLT